LVDADRREHDSHRDELPKEPDDRTRIPRQPRQRHGQQPEREVEKEHRDRALVRISRPEKRHSRPRDVGGERPGERSELARTLGAAHELPASSKAAPATTAYSGTSRFASVPPTRTGIRAGTQASVRNANAHGQRRKSKASATATTTPTTRRP
jgi:hypothetical protein